MRTWAWRIGLVLLAALTQAPAAQGYLADYYLLPTEHDDQGRSDEPDRLATSILGPRVDNCVVSFSPLAVPGTTRACVPDPQLPSPSGRERVIAPGCSADEGRQPSGLCALWSTGSRAQGVTLVPPHTVGVPGMTGGRAPGAYTPLQSSSIRLLDLQEVAFPVVGLGGARFVEVNRKLDDAGAFAIASGLAQGPGKVLLAGTGFWAWYGVWQDKNGNGVIDHLDDGNEQGVPRALATNEFRWVGSCGTLQADLCLRETGLVFPLWIHPGGHHQGCGVAIGCAVPADYPGHQPACLVADSAGLPAVTTMQCEPAMSLDDESLGGDPVFGVHGSIAADGSLIDRTFRTASADRLWLYGTPAGSSQPAWFYDQSLLLTTTIVGGPTLGDFDPALAQRYDLARLQFVDVDRFATWSPFAEEVLRDSVKPAARGPWLTVRSTYAPALTLADGTANPRALDLSPTLSPFDDQVRDPGWSREPNTPFDLQPGAAHAVHAPAAGLPAGEQQHRGWLNSMAGYRSGWHAFADLQARRVESTYGNFRLPALGAALPLGASGGVVGDTMSMLPSSAGFPRQPGDHGRTLDPGIYQFRGFIGAWRDLPQGMVERVLDPQGTVEHGQLTVREERYTLPPDGWVGNVVNTTGGFRYRGYGNVACTIEGTLATRAWSVCNPYLDNDAVALDVNHGAGQGAGVDLSDPQDYASNEVLGTSPPAQPYVVRVTPAGGTWNVPVLVFRDFFTWTLGDVAAVEMHTGLGPIDLRVLPGQNPSFPATADLLVLPVGNLGQDVQTELAGRVEVSIPARAISVAEVVRDVDAYRAWEI